MSQPPPSDRIPIVSPEPQKRRRSSPSHRRPTTAMPEPAPPTTSALTSVCPTASVPPPATASKATKPLCIIMSANQSKPSNLRRSNRLRLVVPKSSCRAPPSSSSPISISPTPEPSTSVPPDPQVAESSKRRRKDVSPPTLSPDTTLDGDSPA